MNSRTKLVDNRAILVQLRFQYKVAVAMAIAGIGSMIDFLLVLVWAYRKCGDRGCDLGLAQDFGLLLIFGILLVGFGIATTLFAWDPITMSKRPI
jgi:hypothetical protein